MRSGVFFRVLSKHIFHELLFILSLHRNYYTDWFSFDSTRKIFLRNLFLAGVNIKILILTAVKISELSLLENKNLLFYRNKVFLNLVFNGAVQNLINSHVVQILFLFLSYKK